MFEGGQPELPGLGIRGDSITETKIHHLLSNDRRRCVIEHLKEERPWMTLRQLADDIAELEADESPAPSNLRDSVYVSLHQSHLPKLDEAGIVDYDQDRKEVTLQDTARQVDVYMEVVTRWGVTQATYYRLLATFGLLTIVLAEIGTLSAVPGNTVLYASLFLAIVAVSTAHQLWEHRWLLLRRLFASNAE
ncbi:hypothetical protein [Haloarchaeobius sp. HME9146]|uniref:DUF7344 domain-containing protein n=1 Tax=Haloarchaeobius sp. HME9146 TaxID=2978732 RepID=UPI0021BE6472|nr:hypothetical protein [Haloarchaeobius sp. HME9146]MCT9097347.1 hypothetical protein [Haloarchaeobius sp. HME9146]